MVTRFSRRAIPLCVLFLIVRILADMATPQLPGAYRLDPTESVQAAEAASATVAMMLPPESSASPAQVGMETAPRRPKPSAAVPPAHAFFPRVVHFSESSSPPASDDD